MGGKGGPSKWRRWVPVGFPTLRQPEEKQRRKKRIGGRVGGMKLLVNFIPPPNKITLADMAWHALG